MASRHCRLHGNPAALGDLRCCQCHRVRNILQHPATYTTCSICLAHGSDNRHGHEPDGRTPVAVNVLREEM